MEVKKEPRTPDDPNSPYPPQNDHHPHSKNHTQYARFQGVGIDEQEDSVLSNHLTLPLPL